MNKLKERVTGNGHPFFSYSYSIVLTDNNTKKEVLTNKLDEWQKKSNKNALMVFLFALSLQTVSEMIPNKVKSKSINKLDSLL